MGENAVRSRVDLRGPVARHQLQTAEGVKRNSGLGFFQETTAVHSPISLPQQLLGGPLLMKTHELERR